MAFASQDTRLQTQSRPPDEERGEDDRRAEVPGQLVVTCCHAPPVFEPAERALNDIAVTISGCIERRDVLPPRMGADHRFGAALGEELAKAIAVIGGVAKQQSGRRKRLEQRRRNRHIAPLTGCKIERNQAAESVDDGMDLRGPAAAAAPDRLRLRPPFPPALHRWALLVVLSIDCVSD